MSDATINLVVLYLIERVFNLLLAIELFHVRKFLKPLSVKNAFNKTENRLYRIVVRRIREIKDGLDV